MEELIQEALPIFEEIKKTEEANHMEIEPIDSFLAAIKTRLAAIEGIGSILKDQEILATTTGEEVMTTAKIEVFGQDKQWVQDQANRVIGIIAAEVLQTAQDDLSFLLHSLGQFKLLYQQGHYRVTLPFHFRQQIKQEDSIV